MCVPQSVKLLAKLNAAARGTSEKSTMGLECPLLAFTIRVGPTPPIQRSNPQFLLFAFEIACWLAAVVFRLLPIEAARLANFV
jgi:hypothetical protein